MHHYLQKFGRSLTAGPQKQRTALIQSLQPALHITCIIQEN